ncbi:hypothetical protein GCM10007036_21960 [Alsobacter metallidurans]|uniref:Sulfatase-modifying factor enzyme-like domain-containing protein n=1 Tax=Alsobacter metallidurans TaxID=340221 RepID=A0A917MHV7_9HYPH|nr:formylglycine-generating enzyme family protein [Alsobacter metallidurans]GGH19234.1 hypothetical protein GCM10007036_21960 [Alsobacter metallidurans]
MCVRAGLAVLILRGVLGASAALLWIGCDRADAQARRPAEAPRAAPAPDDTLETRFWNSIRGADVAADFRTYLDAYPNGRFAAQARARLRELEGAAAAPAAPSAPSRAPAAAPRQVDKPAQVEKPGQGDPPRQAAPAAPGRQPAPAVVQDCDGCPPLATIQPGSFSMGSTELFPFEGPVHAVTIRKPFLLGVHEVTFAEWDACVADGGCSYAPPDRGAGRGNRPVSNLDWNDAQQYVAWLSRKTGKTYRLPTESEWEYAARAGGATAYPWGVAMEKGRAQCGGCNPEPAAAAAPVGSFPANAFGLFDMAGNVAEWVEDCWNDSYKGAPADGSAWTRPRCPERVLRGGSFNTDQRYVRSASRYKYDFDVRFYTNGMRVAREP